MDTLTTNISKQILAVVDLQPHSRQVIEHALFLGRQRDLPITVLHVVHESGKSAGFYRRHDEGNPVLPMKEIAKRLLKQLVAEVIAGEEEGTALPRIATQVVAGIPSGRILEVAEREDADTIVMLNDDCCGLAKLWHGSVAEDVLKRTDRNMVLLHQETDATPALSRIQPEMASQALAG